MDKHDVDYVATAIEDMRHKMITKLGSPPSDPVCIDDGDTDGKITSKDLNTCSRNVTSAAQRGIVGSGVNITGKDLKSLPDKMGSSPSDVNTLSDKAGSSPSGQGLPDDALEVIASSTGASAMQLHGHNNADLTPQGHDSGASAMQPNAAPMTPELQAAVQAASAAYRRDNNLAAALDIILDAAVCTFRQTNMEAWRKEAASAMQYETLQKPLVPNIQAANDQDPVESRLSAAPQGHDTGAKANAIHWLRARFDAGHFREPTPERAHFDAGL